MCDLTYLFVVIVWVSGSLYPTFLLALFASRIEIRLGVTGVAAVRGGKGELRRMLCKLRGCVYGATKDELPIVIRRRGVRGVPGDLVGVWAAKVKILGCSDPADCGGVNANAVAVAVVGSLVLSPDGGPVGVRFGYADKGVSG